MRPTPAAFVIIMTGVLIGAGGRCGSGPGAAAANTARAASAAGAANAGNVAAGVSSSSWLDCYADPPSVVQGDSLRICASTGEPEFDLRIRRDAPDAPVLLDVRGIPGRIQPVPAAAWENGCGWRPSYAFAVPAGWPSGVYLCDLGTAGTVLGHAIFTVREDRPGSTSSILFQNSIATWQAYNGWGGKSLYEFNSSDSVRAASVSFRRPYAQSRGLGDYTYAEQPFVRWLAREGIAVEFCTDLDTHADPHLLDAYALLLVVGHDEYWSWEQRQHVEAFVASGGNLGIFAGNTCWWQIRVSPDLDRITCYKDRELDPFRGVDDSRVTVQWCAPPVSRPENLLTGASWRNGGFVNAEGWYPASLGHGGYQAHHTDHWVFAGTGLGDGDTFGRAATIVGYETDGALVSWASGQPVPTGADRTPLSYCILGTAPASWGTATMGIHHAGGTVFNAATIDWAHGLASDATVARITCNVVSQLSRRDSLFTSSPAPEGLRAEMLPGRRVRLSWGNDVGAEAAVAVYAVDGRRVTHARVISTPEGGAWVWDLRDGGGRNVARGIYAARLTGTRSSLVTRIGIRP